MIRKENLILKTEILNDDTQQASKLSNLLFSTHREGDVFVRGTMKKSPNS